ncbi:DNA polymerase III subunit gamma/tau [Zavarzinia compransoris]|uniref:DNA polymerase III subunit gamma/tau n=1 Tax=Zavarzinia marina TaxID=2911065 RepID=UPI001F43C185|nr:DNA polymerase III subunit gamma/tau [Zavarzinia marina]MCF4165826.1 DNA polymerase III subunit gamma/tau [Zavarzinia marina]
MTDNPIPMDTPAEPYRVLARKYRPSTFAELIGQEAMVRTLTNAIAAGRLAHAFMLTGVRGVGKTTTARIIAKGLNCIGPDGRGGPTVEPCGTCANCIAIAESRHIDVQEMDAASRTGVNDIREIIEGVRFAAVQARFKIYIIDEVHMLSTSAFNALLKTLEEPPPHVKFIFATTEIRKVPVTVLSRCQRFDLRRIDQDRLIAHLGGIAAREGANVSPAALALLARAAEGSVRDALSLLDQAIAHAAGEVGEEAVRDMLGLADRARVFDLFEMVMRGDAKAALTELGDQYDTGADPAVVLQDLLELSHWLTRLKIVPEAAAEATASEHDRNRGLELSRALSMPVLARSWQMLLKGLGEVRVAPSPLSAAEMILIRLAYAADLPPPADVVKQYVEERDGRTPPRGPQGGGGGGPAAYGGAPAVARQPVPAEAPGRAPMASRDHQPRAEGNVVYLNQEETAPAVPDSFAAVVALFERHREIMLSAHLSNDAHLVEFAPGRIILRLAPGAQNRLREVAAKLDAWTGMRWTIDTSTETGADTLGNQAREARNALVERLKASAPVRALETAFPGIRLLDVRPLPKQGMTGPLDDEAEETDMDDEDAPILDIFDFDTDDD